MPDGPDPPPHAGDPPRFELGRYELRRELGRGAMGVVYEALERGLERRVALKLIATDRLRDPAHLERFRLEAVAAARVQHPGIVAIYDAGSIHGQPFIAMELVEGRTLDEVWEAEPFDAFERARRVAEVARAVHCLHAAGIVHRDLKPGNLLVDREGRVRVADFGLALMMRSRDAGDEPVVAGSPGFIAPEVLREPASRIGPAADVYALGAVLYTALTGRPPGVEPGADDLLAVLFATPVPPRRLHKGVPAALEAICLRCLERTPEARYPSAAALAEDLERFLAGEPVEAQRTGPLTQARRWMRHHPSLGWRVLAFATFYAVTWVNHAALGVVDGVFVRRITVLLLAWTVAAFAFDRVELSWRRPGWLPFVWVLVDAAFFTLVLLVADGPVSPLVIGYLLLVAVAGYWGRTGPVWWAAGLSLLSYGALWVEAAARRPHLAGRLDRHLVFATAVLVLAGVVSRYVARTRALGRLLRHGR